jgi:hypothetical protein
VIFNLFLTESIVENIAPDFPNMVVSKLVTSDRNYEADEETIFGRNFKLQNGSRLEEYSIVFIGKDGPTLFNIALQLHGMLQQVYFINRTLGH